MSNEQWRPFPVEGLSERFEVSNRGDIRDSTTQEILEPEQVPRTTLSAGRRIQRGYVKIKIDDRWFRLHLIVLDAFAGTRPLDHVGRHLNDDRNDNRWPENLAWGTESDNRQDAHLNHSRRDSRYLKG